VWTQRPLGFVVDISRRTTFVHFLLTFLARASSALRFYFARSFGGRLTSRCHWRVPRRGRLIFKPTVTGARARVYVTKRTGPRVRFRRHIGSNRRLVHETLDADENRIVRPSLFSLHAYGVYAYKSFLLRNSSCSNSKTDLLITRTPVVVILPERVLMTAANRRVRNDDAYCGNV